MKLRNWVLVLTLVSRLSSASEAPIQVAHSDLSNCLGGKRVSVTFPFENSDFRSGYRLMVVKEGLLTWSELLVRLRSRGLSPVAMINGGYFGSQGVLSYFKSSVNAYQHSANSARSPRACMVHDSFTGSSRTRFSTEENYQIFKRSVDSEIFCAGPKLVEEGVDVSERQYCLEQFDPNCRVGRTDPGLGFYLNYPRTGTCVTADGKLKLLAMISDQSRCGGTAAEFTEAMIEEGCIDGMNHDGGGSAHLWIEGRTDLPTGIGDRDRPSGRDRTVPVWIVVVSGNENGS